MPACLLIFSLINLQQYRPLPLLSYLCTGMTQGVEIVLIPHPVLHASSYLEFDPRECSKQILLCTSNSLISSTFFFLSATLTFLRDVVDKSSTDHLILNILMGHPVQ